MLYGFYITADMIWRDIHYVRT